MGYLPIFLFIGTSNELGEVASGLTVGLLGPGVSVVLGGVAVLVIVSTWAVTVSAVRNWVSRPADKCMAPPHATIRRTQNFSGAISSGPHKIHKVTYGGNIHRYPSVNNNPHHRKHICKT